MNGKRCEIPITSPSTVAVMLGQSLYFSCYFPNRPTTPLVDLTLIQDGRPQCKLFDLDGLTQKSGTVNGLSRGNNWKYVYICRLISRDRVKSQSSLEQKMWQ